MNSFHEWLFLSKSTNNIEILSLDYVILLWLQDLLLFSLFQIDLFLNVKRSLRTTFIILGNFVSSHKVCAVISVVIFWLKCNNWALFFITIVLLLLSLVIWLIITSLWLLELRVSFVRVMLRPIDSLRHSHYHFLWRWLLWIVLHFYFIILIR